MGLTSHKIEKILDVPLASPDYLLSLPTVPSSQACDEAIRALRIRLQGRARTDMRYAHKGYMAFIESHREKGRLKEILKAILGSHAGRRHQDGLDMSVVTNTSGDVVGDPKTIHEVWTDHYNDFYKLPDQFDNELHRTLDWEPIVKDRTRFMKIHATSNIPQWCLDIIYESLQIKAGADVVHNSLAMILEPPPSVEDLYASIRRTKTNSAPGPSGLSYNMLKSFPREMVEYVHSLIVHYWAPGPKPVSWKWRWLHLIPKTVKDNMGLNDCRPLMLCEVLRKIWSNILLARVMSAFNRGHILDDIQHGFVSGKGTDSASILHLNYMEDVEEKRSISHQTSFDQKKAFDSTSIPLVYWSLRRLGVPDAYARELAMSDVDGTTVVRSPYAESLWYQLPYRCVHTDGTYPAGGVASTPDSAIVKSFCPERGTGQGDPPSPLKWNAMFDIVATGLRLLEADEPSPTYVAGEDNSVYHQKDCLYADDTKAASHSAEVLQRKADLISAFCIVLGLQLSESKIRRVVQSFTPTVYGSHAMTTTVYSVGWVPHVVKVQTTGSIEFLGGIYDMNNSSISTLEWLKTKATIAVQCIGARKGFSAASKIAVVTASTLHSLVYKATNATLSHEALQEVDKIIDTTLVKTTKNMFSFPRKLLHIDRSRGGLGLPSFSVLAESRKLQKLFSCLRTQQSHAPAAKGLLCRAARKHGIYTSPGQSIVIIPQEIPVTTQHVYCDGPISLLSQHGLFLCRHGTKLDMLTAAYPLLTLTSNFDETLRTYCFENGFMTLGDITEFQNHRYQWYLPENLAVLKSSLPLLPSFDSPTLIYGQYWSPGLHLAGQPWGTRDVLRIDGREGDDVHVTLFKHVRGTLRYKINHGTIVVARIAIFPHDTTTRCHLTPQRDGYFKLTHSRRQPSPKWGSYRTDSMPAWITWINEHLSKLGDNYIARPYTDGSYTRKVGLDNYFRMDGHDKTATASIIIKDDSHNWKSKPVLAIYIDEGSGIGSDSVFTMEYLALAGALQATVASEGRLHATGSDAKSVLDVLTGRRQRLQAVTKDHHFLLQCVDHYLYKGASPPFHIRSHVERRKPAKHPNGQLGATWTNHEWGNWIADRIAAQDISGIVKQGIKFHMITVKAKDLYSQLPYEDQWYIGDRTGAPVYPRGVHAVMQETLHLHYLTERDAYRIERGELPKWEHDSTMEHAAIVFELSRSSPAEAAAKTRIMYDKGFHGGNRAKDDSLTQEERNHVGQCLLCHCQESQNHWLHHCSFGAMHNLRMEIFAKLNRTLLQYREKSALHRQLGTAFKNILMTTAEPARIWTANWSKTQISELGSLVCPELLTNLGSKTISSILLPLEKILAEGALNMWQCKMAQERRMPTRPADIRGISRLLSQTSGDETPIPLPSHNPATHHIPKSRRIRDTIPITTTTSNNFITKLVLPVMTTKMADKFTRVTLTHRLSAVVNTIAGYSLHGEHYRRLHVNEDGAYSQDGYMHVRSVRAFLSLVSPIENKAILLSEVSTSDFQDGLIDSSVQVIKDLTTTSDTLPRWFLLLIPDTNDRMGDCWSMICYDTKDGISYYISLESELPEVTSRNLDQGRRLLNLSGLYSQKTWTETIIISTNVRRTDCGVWICLQLQFLLGGVRLPTWCPEYGPAGRQYIASCLLGECCPDARSLLISQVGENADNSSSKLSLAPMEITTGSVLPAHDHVNDISRTVLIADDKTTSKDWLQNPSSRVSHVPTDTTNQYETRYNMLHPSYKYSPTYTVPVSLDYVRHPDLRQVVLSEVDKSTLLQWLQKPTSTIINPCQMEIPVRISAQDIHDLLCPATLSNELLHHLITSACPPEHPKVTIAGQLLTDVLDLSLIQI